MEVRNNHVITCLLNVVQAQADKNSLYDVTFFSIICYFTVLEDNYIGCYNFTIMSWLHGGWFSGYAVLEYFQGCIPNNEMGEHRE